MRDEKWYVCECHSLEHFFVISFDDTEGWNDAVFINVYLSHLPFHKRLILGIKYILGFRTKYGSYEEVILSKTNVEDLMKRLELYHSKMR